MIRGFFLSKAGIALILMFGLVILPTFVAKAGVENPVTDWLTEPFTAMSVIIIVGAIFIYPYLRPHWISVVMILGLVAMAYIYVWTLLM